jgi:hypothetical protein
MTEVAIAYLTRTCDMNFPTAINGKTKFLVGFWPFHQSFCDQKPPHVPRLTILFAQIVVRPRRRDNSSRRSKVFNLVRPTRQLQPFLLPPYRGSNDLLSSRLLFEWNIFTQCKSRIRAFWPTRATGFSERWFASQKIVVLFRDDPGTDRDSLSLLAREHGRSKGGVSRNCPSLQSLEAKHPSTGIPFYYVPSPNTRPSSTTRAFGRRSIAKILMRFEKKFSAYLVQAFGNIKQRAWGWSDDAIIRRIPSNPCHRHHQDSQVTRVWRWIH